jgi:hypothetical protein
LPIVGDWIAGHAEVQGDDEVNHDITFCANSDQCPKAETCRRAHPPMDVEWLSFAAFYAIDEDCAVYWPTGEVK